MNGSTVTWEPRELKDGALLTGYGPGGIGLFGHGLVDTHFANRGRHGRLIQLLVDSAGLTRGATRAFGMDENTALVVTGAACFFSCMIWLAFLYFVFVVCLKLLTACISQLNLTMSMYTFHHHSFHFYVVRSLECPHGDSDWPARGLDLQHRRRPPPAGHHPLHRGHQREPHLQRGCDRSEYLPGHPCRWVLYY